MTDNKEFYIDVDVKFRVRWRMPPRDVCETVERETLQIRLDWLSNKIRNNIDEVINALYTGVE